MLRLSCIEARAALASAVADSGGNGDGGGGHDGCAVEMETGWLNRE
jgi:hypothetical protein